MTSKRKVITIPLTTEGAGTKEETPKKDLPSWQRKLLWDPEKSQKHPEELLNGDKKAD